MDELGHDIDNTASTVSSDPLLELPWCAPIGAGSAPYRRRCDALLGFGGAYCCFSRLLLPPGTPDDPGTTSAADHHRSAGSACWRAAASNNRCAVLSSFPTECPSFASSPSICALA